MSLTELFKSIRVEPVERCPLCGSRGTKGSLFEHDRVLDDSIQIMKCGSCAFIYVSGVVNSVDAPRLYDAYNKERDVIDPRLDEQRTLMYQLDLRFARSFLRNTDQRILDVGCADGDFLELFDNIPRKYGIEVDTTARQRGVIKHPSIDFREICSGQV